MNMELDQVVTVDLSDELLEMAGHKTLEAWTAGPNCTLSTNRC